MKRKIFAGIIGLLTVIILSASLTACSGGSNPPPECGDEHSYEYFYSVDGLKHYNVDSSVMEIISEALKAPALESASDKNYSSSVSLNHVAYCTVCGDYVIEKHAFESAPYGDDGHNLSCNVCGTSVSGPHCYKADEFACYYCGEPVLDNLFRYDPANGGVLTFAPGAESFTAETLVLPETFEGGTINRFGKVEGIESTFPNVKKLVIPSSYYEIKAGAFFGWTGLEEVMIGVDGISRATVYSQAFEGCTGLKKVTVKGEITAETGSFAGCTALTDFEAKNAYKICDGAFYGCTALKNLTVRKSTEIYSLFVDTSRDEADYPKNITLTISDYIENSVTDDVLRGQKDFIEALVIEGTIVEIDGFSDCVNLKTVTAPAVKVIGAHCFSGCTALASFDFSNVITIKSLAFADCTALSAVEFSAEIEEIEDRAFKGCTSLTKVTVPALSGDNLGSCIFENCTSITEATLSGNIAPYGIFMGCTALATVNAPEVTVISDSAFSDCSALVTLDLSESLAEIGYQAFKNCVLFKRFSFPNTIVSLDSDIFEGCALDEIYYNVPYIERFNVKNVKKIIIGKDVEVIPSSFAEVWESFDNPITVYLEEVELETGGKLKEIGNSAFRDNHSLTVFDLSGVEKFGDYCFYGCSSLAEADFSSAVSIGSSAFANCTSLKEVSLPNTVTSISDNVFGGVYLDNLYYNVPKTSSDSCFIGNAKRVTIGKDVEAIPGQFIFKASYDDTENKPVLEVTVEASETLFTIGNSAFAHGEFEYFDFSRVKSVGDDAFIYCTNLTEVDLVNAEAIGQSAFSGCTSITSVAFYSKVTSLKSDVLYGCHNIENFFYDVPRVEDFNYGYVGVAKNITIGKNVEAIPGGFANCFGGGPLEVLTFEDDSICAEIGSHAFYGASENLTTVTLPATLTLIDDFAFGCCPGLQNVVLNNRDVLVDTNAFYECDKFEYEEDSSCLYVGNSVIGVKEGVTNPVIKNGILYIPQHAMVNVSFETLTIPSSVICVEDDAIRLGSLRELIISGDKFIDVPMTIRDTSEFVGISFRGFYFTNAETIVGIKNKNTNRILIPKGVKEIADEAFKDIPLLKYVYIPASVEKIGRRAFYGCDSNVELYLEGSSLPSQLSSGWNSITSSKTINTSLMKANVKADANGYIWAKYAGKVYVTGYIGVTTSINIPSTIEGEQVYAVADYAFENRTEAYSIRVGEGIEAIGIGAFRGCTNVQDITLLEGLTTISKEAFKGINNSLLSTVTIPYTVETIVGDAFASFGSEYLNVHQQNYKDYHWIVVNINTQAPVKDFGLNGITSAVDFAEALTKTYCSEDYVWINASAVNE